MNRIFIMVTIFSFLAGFSCKKATRVECPQESAYGDFMPTPQTEICSDQACGVYIAIWKEAFLEKNNMTEEYFNRHIKITRTFLTKQDAQFPNKLFAIDIQASIGWASAGKFTYSFPVLVTQKDANHPGVDMPLNTNLNREQIQLIIDSAAYSSNILKFNPVESLSVGSYSQAINRMESKANVNRFCHSGAYINAEGNLAYSASAFIPDEGRCINTDIDLVTENIGHYDGPCLVY